MPPVRRLRGLVALLGEGRDLLLEFRDAAECGAPDGALAEQRKPALDLVQPRGMGRGEVQVEARPPREPGTHVRVLVRGTVVADKVNAGVLGGLLVDQPQEREPACLF